MTTSLDGYLAAHGITNEAFAARLRARGLRATEGWISRIRNGGECGKKLARAIQEETTGEVSASALCGLGGDDDEEDGDACGSDAA